MYKKLKKQKGEKFAQTLRNYHNGIMEIPDLDQIVRHAGRDAEPLLPYLMSLLLASNDNSPVSAPKDPFTLLDQAGYNAFHADTLEKQNSIKHYFAPGELLCTFNDAARYKNYHIVHAIKKDVDHIRRSDFNGHEQREDEYGASVISIQMLKSGNFISIKNRYNDTVAAADNTFNSNPDNIIQGLSAALRNHFNVDFSATELPDEFVLMGNAIFKYHTEYNNIYYGNQAWAQNGMVHMADRAAGDALFDQFLFDNQTKTLKKIDKSSADSFPDDFNRCYGGNKALCVINGNLTLNGEILIGAEASRIKTVSLPDLTTAGDNFLRNADALTQFQAPALTTAGDNFLYNADALTQLQAPALTTAGHGFLSHARALTQLQATAITTVGDNFLYNAHALTQIQAPALTTVGHGFLRNAQALTQFQAPALITAGNSFLFNADALTQIQAPALITVGNDFLYNADALIQFQAPALTTVGDGFLFNAIALTQLQAPALTTVGHGFLGHARALTQLQLPALATVGDGFLYNAHARAQKIGRSILRQNRKRNIPFFNIQ